ncbi:hypothetical protein POM88_000410 [Heracleum sosnowskyi]|uniref:Ubiquitin-like protease family profile domain-containing protein n=1 Tax=Heracleum sosnowskyi TaxID=360622 RepID=A0AAD8JAB8_9APIA|nr:hypothetical protein POM88_000410 [Heracleum sosnowskyi]
MIGNDEDERNYIYNPGLSGGGGWRIEPLLPNRGKIAERTGSLRLWVLKTVQRGFYCVRSQSHKLTLDKGLCRLQVCNNPRHEYEQNNATTSMNTRSFKEIQRRIKRKSRRPPQSPCKDTVNRGSENWFGEEAETAENIRTEEQARFNTKNDEQPKKRGISTKERQLWMKSVSIAIKNGRIYINEEDVFTVIGLPHGGKPIELKDTEVTSRRGQEWLAQFPDKQITVARVIVRVRAGPRVTEMFKINFLIVLSNVLIGTPTHSYFDKQLVKFEYLDRCVSYNWAKFLIEYLWEQHIQRNDDDQWRQRNDNDQWRRWPNIQKDDNSNVEQHGADADYDQRFVENEYVDNVNVEDTNYEKEDSEEDPMDVLRLRATEIINAKIQFEKDLEEAIKREPDNDELLLIQDVINEVFDAKNGSKNGNENSNVQVQQDIRDPEHQNMPDPVDDFELDPTVLEQLEIIEYLNSEQGIKDMNEMLPAQRKSSDLFVPSFSLGPEIEIISEICKDINNEHEAVVEDDGFVTPKPLVREKSTRHIKLGQYAKSPYIERVIDINGKYTTEDIMMWRYMALQNRDNMEEVFAWKGVKCIREHIQTMKNCTKLYYSVIDTWSTILNDKEKYKADESPMRLFCTIGRLKWSLDPQKKVADIYQIFFSNMNDMISKYPSKELKDMDMVFFPIHAHEHFYLICYNLRNLAYEVIDNVKHGEDAKIFYGRIPTIMHSHFCKYLQWNGFENLSRTVRKLKPSFFRMPW